MSGAIKLPFEAKRVEQRGSGEWIWCVNGANGMLVISRTNEANAEFIVRACNAHGDLVRALGAAQSALRSFEFGNESREFARDMAKNCQVTLTKAGAA